MANPGALCCSIALQAFTVLSLLAALVAYVKGADGCPHFSCGHLKNLSDPFRQQGDPPGCGSEYYKLECSDSQAIIRLGNAAYDVTGVNYTDSSFWAVATIFDTNSSCPLPASISYPWGKYDSDGSYLEFEGHWACFANCSQAITDNSRYKPVACLSANNSFVYVWSSYRYHDCEMEYLERSCGYLAMAPFGRSSISDKQVLNASYEDIMHFVRKGFAVSFPSYPSKRTSASTLIKECLSNSTR